LAIAIAAGAATAPAHADPQRVALVRPTGADPTIAEAMHRIHGELRAEGFDVVEVDAPPDSTAPAASPDAGPTAAPSATQAAAPGATPIATITLSMDEGTRVAELRVFDRLTNKIVVRRAPVEPEAAAHPAEVLAVRAVELLRASLLELLVEPRRPAAAPASDVRQASRWAARALPAEQQPKTEPIWPAWAIEAGAAILGDFGGVPPAVLPLARVRRSIAGPVGARLTIAGLGTQPHVTTSAGSAAVTQAFGLAEVVATLGAMWPVRPFFTLGAGAAYVGVEGKTSGPYLPRNDARWGFAGDVGAGMEIRLGKHLSLSFEGHALGIAPYPVVQILRADVAKTGEPSLAGSASVVGWL
jgi:hypothetical protein